jgi:hypothetical protein
MCRRWKGGPLFSFGFDGDPVIEGADNVGVYKSSAWAERAFCKTCGAYLYWHLIGSDHYAFSAGLLDDQTGLKFTTEIFIDEKPAYYDFANDTKKQTGAESWRPSRLARRRTERGQASDGYSSSSSAALRRGLQPRRRAHA